MFFTKKIVSPVSEKPSFYSTLVSGWKFAEIGYINDQFKYRRKQQKKILFHVFLNPFFAKEWFKILNSSRFNYIFLQRPRIYIKPFRVYISSKWNKKQKVKVILDTYRFLKSKGNILESFLTDKEGITIAVLNLDEFLQSKLILEYDDRFRKEGELVLTLKCDSFGGNIVSAAFSFEERQKDIWTCIIGCVQVHGRGNGQEAFKNIQKKLHGVRPNVFILNSVQELVKQLSCNNIYATGNAIQANRQKHAINLSWLHKINFDYDNFWKEVGGQDVNEGWFQIPLECVRKNFQEIPSKKRSMYRKRYDMLEELSTKIEDSLQKYASVNLFKDTIETTKNKIPINQVL